MDPAAVDTLVEDLVRGFQALQNEYQKLFTSHEALERKLAKAREQYHEIAKQWTSGSITTPPLSLSSSTAPEIQPTARSQCASDILAQRTDLASSGAADTVRAASKAIKTLQSGLQNQTDAALSGVKIWSGPSADRTAADSSIMPSISESPLEQDFTVEGKPSRLGCPFASTASKKLSSHAASVLSRFQQRSSDAHSSILGSIDRIHGRDVISRRSSRRESLVDPIKAEICGLSTHDAKFPPSEAVVKDQAGKDPNGEPGVCPIRFLDQHSPEEVATYFERHKHELPRSHEICVKRYQSNKQQIQELDARYGNLVSMIQGLGEKHKDMLPREPEDGATVEDIEDARTNEQVRKWASSVSMEAGDEVKEMDGIEDDVRVPHFERPLREIRVGESPSRPWGVPVPAKYLEREGSEPTSQPAEISPPILPGPDTPTGAEDESKKRPLGHSKEVPIGRPTLPSDRSNVGAQAENSAAAPSPQVEQRQDQTVVVEPAGGGKPQQIVFNGPVFFGYDAEAAAKFLQDFAAG